jgi:hypothetical protein
LIIFLLKQIDLLKNRRKQPRNKEPKERDMWREVFLDPELLGCLVVYGGMFLLAWIGYKIWG